MITIMSDFPLHLLDGLAHDTLETDAGQRLFSRDDPVRWLYLVQSGEIHLIRQLEAGRDLVMCRYNPGSLVAEGSMFSERYHCDAVSEGESRVSRFDSSEVQARIKSDPEAAWAWSIYLTQGLQAARTRAEILSLKTVRERLEAWFIIHPASNESPSSWKSVANEIGVSPEALYRELARRRKS